MDNKTTSFNTEIISNKIQQAISIIILLENDAAQSHTDIIVTNAIAVVHEILKSTLQEIENSQCNP